MPSLGLLMAWGGYWLLTYGLALRKNANVTLLNLAQPSQRAATLDAMRQAWGSQPTPSTGQGSQGKSGGGGVTIPVVPGGFGPSVHIPGTNIKAQL